MKKIILLLLVFATIKFSAQNPVPPFINYQGVARDVAGVPIPSQNIGIFFELLQGTATGSLSYSEAQTVTTNSLGLFTTQIGKPPANLGVVNWQNGPYFLRISIDPTGGSNYTPLGTQQLVSVPYALYAEKAGNSALPTATLNGTTLRYNSGNSTWVIDTNMVNNGIRVKIGDKNNIQKNKVTVLSNNNVDSSAIFGLNNNSVSNGAAIRGFVSGSTAQTGTATGIGIFGGHFVSYNVTGIGIGVLGQGSSLNSNGVGLMGIGSSTGTTVNNNFAIGLFASVDATCAAQNKFAGIFDKGGVLINDSLLLGSTQNPGSVGDVLTRTSTGRAKWAPAGGGSGPFTNSTNYIYAAPSFTTDRILFGIPFSGSLSYQSRVTVVNSSSNTNDTALAVFQKNSSKPSIYAESSGFGSAIQALNTNALSNAFAGFFDGGVTIKAKTIAGAFALNVIDNISNPLITSVNNGLVGLSINAPTTRLHLFGANTSTALNGFSASPETALRIHNEDLTDNNFESIIFSSKSSSLGNYENAKIISQNINHNTIMLSGDLVFLTRDPSNINEKLRLTGTGLLKVSNPASAPIFTNTSLFISRPGSFDNRIIITGGDNTNTYGGILSFAENQNQIYGMSIKMDAAANKLFFTNDLAGSTPVVGIGGYAGGSTNGMSIGTNYAYSNSPVDGLIVEGNVGVATTAPLAKLDVNGNFKLGNQGNIANNLIHATVSYSLAGFIGTGIAGPFSLIVPNVTIGAKVFLNIKQNGYLSGTGATNPNCFIIYADVISAGNVQFYLYYPKTGTYSGSIINIDVLQIN